MADSEHVPVQVAGVVGGRSNLRLTGRVGDIVAT
jgi:hypothetical protein